VAEEAAELADGRAIRLAGATRYETSVAVADEAQDAGLTSGVVWVATGRNFPDALAAGPAAALAGSPLVLIDGTDVGGSPASAAWIDQHAESLNVVGGEAAISSHVANNLAD
jgi:putative cell wall-binding protein